MSAASLSFCVSTDVWTPPVLSPASVRLDIMYSRTAGVVKVKCCGSDWSEINTMNKWIKSSQFRLLWIVANCIFLSVKFWVEFNLVMLWSILQQICFICHLKIVLFYVFIWLKWHIWNCDATLKILEFHCNVTLCSFISCSLCFRTVFRQSHIILLMLSKCCCSDDDDDDVWWWRFNWLWFLCVWFWRYQWMWHW